MTEQQVSPNAEAEQCGDPRQPHKKLMVYFAKLNSRLTKIEDDESIILNTVFYEESPHMM